MDERTVVEPAEAARSELGTPGSLWIVAVLVVGAFAPVLTAGFLMLDDGQNFAFNLSFRGFSAQHLGWMFTTPHMGNYQPLSWLSHALDYELWGLDGARFHQASVVWHVLVAGFFLLAAGEIYARASGLGRAPDGRPTRRARLAALFATLVFAIHPLRGESVAWLSGRNDVIAGLFFVLSMLAWLRYTRVPLESAAPARPPRVRGLALAALLAALATVLGRLAFDLRPGEPLGLVSHSALLLVPAGVALIAALALVPRALGADRAGRLAYALAGLAAGLSLLGKAYGVVLPALLLVLDVWPFGRLERTRAALGARAGTRKAAALLVAEKLPFLALSLVVAPITLWSKAGGDLRSLSEHSILERIWQAFYGLAFYVRKTLVPSGLSPMVDLPAEIRLGEPRFLFSFLAVVALTLLLVRFRRRAPGALVVGLAYAILIAPALGALQAGAQLVADRYSYFASMALALGIGGLWLGAGRRGPLVQQLAGIGAVAAVLASGVATWKNAALWADPVALFEHGIAATGSPRLMTNLAMTYNEAAASDEQRRAEYLGRALAWSQRAVDTAEALQVSEPLYRLHRGTILHNLGREPEAVADLAWFVERAPTSVEGHLNLAFALARNGQAAPAVAAFERCVELAPTLESAWRGLGAAQEAAGDPERAVASYRRALELAPGNRSVEARLGVLEAR